MDKSAISAVLPLLVIAVVFALRFRNISKPRRLKPGQLWIMPLVLFAMVCFVIAAMPPSAYGWLAMAGSVLVGALIGWKRGHLMHLDRDPVSGDLQMRQSPAALLLILGVIAAKRLVSFETGLDPAGGPGAGGALPAGALILTDAMLGLALGMVVAMRWTLWLRAKAVPPHPTGEA